MHVVDVGHRSADEVLEVLFEHDALKALLRGHGAACFALVRPAAAPAFYRQLIENSETLDVTTGRHVAFVVFYGDRSGLTWVGNVEYGPYRTPTRARLQLRLDGLSVSGDPNHFCAVAEEPSLAGRREGQSSSETGANPFSDQLGRSFRDSPEDVDQSVFARQMSRVATRLMQLYDIRESALPCMLFTDGDRPERHLVVRLDPDEPFDSLNAHVLQPLGDQLAMLSNYWKRRDALEQNRRTGAKAAEASAATAGVELTRFVSEIERDNIPARIVRREQELQLLTQAYHNRMPEQRETVRKLEEELAAIGDGTRHFHSIAEKEMEILKVDKKLFRERDRLAAYASSHGSEETGEMRRLRKQIEQLRLDESGLEKQRHQLEETCARAKRLVEDCQPENLRREAIAVQQLANELEAVGYGPEVLVATPPSVFAAIEVMSRDGKLGIHEPASRAGDRPMRILFLAANPMTTSPLDLEQELRSLDVELRGVEYRDQVSIRTVHAAQADDLVSHVRSERPTVVHFSGHGTAEGIILRNDEGGCTTVTGSSLQRFFEGRTVRLVVLNACYTEELARMISAAVPAVIGTTKPLGDVAARRFTVAFYRALGNGHSIAEAFRDGRDAVVLDNKEDVFQAHGRLDQRLVVPAGK